MTPSRPRPAGLVRSGAAGPGRAPDGRYAVVPPGMADGRKPPVRRDWRRPSLVTAARSSDRRGCTAPRL